MKRFGLSMAVCAAAAMLAAACSNETSEYFADTTDDECVTVTFTVGREVAAPIDDLDDGNGAGNETVRPTISDGSQVDMLICAVYDDGDNLLTQYGTTDDGQIVIENIDRWPVSVPLRLVRERQYKIVFWAQSSQCEAYDTKDLTKVRISYKSEDDDGKGAPNNDELRDAFCKTEPLTAVADGTRTVTLRRPFAQLNIGVSREAFDMAAQKGHEITESSVTIRNAATVLNVVNNSVDTSAEGAMEEITYELSAIAANIYGEDNEQILKMPSVNGEETGVSEFKYLSMCYVLAADTNDGTATYSVNVELDVTFRFADNGQKTINAADKYKVGDKEYDLTAVPLQRNWCTNIIFAPEQIYPESVVEPNAVDAFVGRGGDLTEQMITRGIFTKHK